MAKSTARVLEQAFVTAPLKPRAPDSHKGMFGSVGIIGGAAGMSGAALLAGRAALKCGAGRVYMAQWADSTLTLDLHYPELMFRSCAQLFDVAQLSVLVIGPGLGQSDQAFSQLQRGLHSDLALVLDADALNLIALHADLAQALACRNATTILTPHPAEAARLLKCSTEAIQRDRVGAASTLATRFQCGITLKGKGSICAWPDASLFINPTGNPGLSSAGMGDVLSGMIAAFMAQHLSSSQATLLAVYLHGAAADDLVEQGTGPIGLTASEIIDTSRRLLNHWIYA